MNNKIRIIADAWSNYGWRNFTIGEDGSSIKIGFALDVGTSILFNFDVLEEGAIQVVSSPIGKCIGYTANAVSAFTNYLNNKYMAFKFMANTDSSNTIFVGYDILPSRDQQLIENLSIYLLETAVAAVNEILASDSEDIRPI